LCRKAGELNSNHQISLPPPWRPTSRPPCTSQSAKTKSAAVDLPGASLADSSPLRRTLDIPFPDPRLATVALRALAVDKELSPLVHRDFSTVPSPDSYSGSASGESILRVEYKAITNRMLRVAVNSFLDSLALVIEVMGELDVDVLESQKKNSGI